MNMCNNLIYDYSCDAIYFTWTNGLEEVKLFRMMVNLEIDYPNEMIILKGLTDTFAPTTLSLDYKSGYASCEVDGQPPIAYTTCDGAQLTSEEFANFLKCIQNCVAVCCPS